MALAAGLWLDAGCQSPPTQIHADAGDPPANRLWFTDISDQSPDLAAHATGGGAGWDHSEKFSPGVALLDLDGDGHLDLVQPRNHQSQPDSRGPWLYRGRGDGNFDAAVALPWDSALNATFALAFDFDSDDDSDLLIGVDGGPSALFRNDGDLSFVDVSESAGLSLVGVRAFTAAAGDVDGDADLDVYIGAWNASAPDHGDGTAPNFLFRNEGDGTFVDISDDAGVHCNGWATLGTAFADFDRDGDLDLFVANDYFDACLYENQGDGSFSDIADEAGVLHGAWNGMGVAVGDLDGDLDLDIFVTDDEVMDDSRGNAVYINRGTTPMRFSSQAIELGLDGIAALQADWLVCWGVGLADFDLDGDLDVHVTTHEQRPELFWQQSDAGFEPVYPLMNALADVDGRGSAYGDIDSDGDTDIVVAGRGRGLQILRNDSDSGHWLTVVPRPAQAAPGTVVIVETASRTQMRHIAAGDSYMSTSPARAVFGLGHESTATRVTAHFSNGIIRELIDVAADQVIELRR